MGRWAATRPEREALCYKSQISDTWISAYGISLHLAGNGFFWTRTEVISRSDTIRVDWKDDTEEDVVIRVCQFFLKW